jgi:hypothetical protein
MHNFLIAASGSFVGIGLLFVFIAIIDRFLSPEDYRDLDSLEENNQLWLAIIELEEQVEDLRGDLHAALDAAE